MSAPQFVLDVSTGNLELKTAGGILIGTFSPMDQMILVHAILTAQLQRITGADVQPVPVVAPVLDPVK